MAKAAKVKVVFRTIRIAEDDWNISAQLPGGETIQITGLTSKADADAWMNDDRRIKWLRSQGFAK
jgi:hypothetical protein